MVIDTISHIRQYVSLNPLIAEVADFLVSHDVTSMPPGQYEIRGRELFLNVVDSQPRTESEAVIESHRIMADIQIPISSVERHGYAPLASCHDCPYDEEGDISFHHDVKPTTHFDVIPGQFVLYLPYEGHAPAISDIVLRKAIFKLIQQTK